MKYVVFGIGFLLFLALSFNSCYYDVEEELYTTGFCDTTDISFNGRVNSIITSYCFPCHNAASVNGDINLEGYANVKAQGENGSLLCSVSWDSGCSAMPKNANKLSDCNIRLITKWIENNYPEN